MANSTLQPAVLQLGEVETQISVFMVQHGNGIWYSCYVWLCDSSWKDADANTDTDVD